MSNRHVHKRDSYLSKLNKIDRKERFNEAVEDAHFLWNNYCRHKTPSNIQKLLDHMDECRTINPSDPTRAFRKAGTPGRRLASFKKPVDLNTFAFYCTLELVRQYPEDHPEYKSAQKIFARVGFNLNEKRELSVQFNRVNDYSPSFLDDIANDAQSPKTVKSASWTGLEEDRTGTPFVKLPFTPAQ